MVLSGSTLYGTAWLGGGSGHGTVFGVNTDGTGFRTLHSFTAGVGTYPYITNFDGALPESRFGQGSNDGANPSSSLIRSGNTLYGTADGVVFAIKTDGTGFTNLYSIIGGSGGLEPNAGLILSYSTLYGTTQNGGDSGSGTVFSLSFTAQLTIVASGANVVLTWPTNYDGFDYTAYSLQSTTNLLSPAWTTHSAAPFVINGQNTVTNPISGTQQFFRLSQ